MKKYALISVFDKSNLKKLCNVFSKYQIKIISTGSTAKHIKKIGYNCRELSSFTKFKEILDGRVKSLHPKIHASLLFKRNNKKHINSFNNLNFPEINFVIVNLYPFSKVMNSNNKISECIEMIDIGGQTLLRSAAKNYDSVTTISNISDYNKFIEDIKKNNGSTSLEFRKNMALKVFQTTSLYEKNIYKWFKKLNKENNKTTNNKYKLRYGENPNQKAEYISTSKINVLNKSKLNGRDLSYNNILDIDSALNCIDEFNEPTCAIIKHNNPCGVASSHNISDAYKKAFKSDPNSAFGGVIIINRKLNYILAQKIKRNFFEIIIAKSFDKKAVSTLAIKNNLILIDSAKLSLKNNKEFKSVVGGLLYQKKNKSKVLLNELKKVSKKSATKNELRDLLFAIKVSKYVKSNSVVLAKNLQTVGIGAGQMSRIDATKVALMKINNFNKKLKNFVAASDAFFPFNDSIKLLNKRGCNAIVQPKGSINDANLIDYGDKNKMKIYFTKKRFFKH